MLARTASWAAPMRMPGLSPMTTSDVALHQLARAARAWVHGVDDGSARAAGHHGHDDPPRADPAPEHHHTSAAAADDPPDDDAPDGAVAELLLHDGDDGGPGRVQVL